MRHARGASHATALSALLVLAAAHWPRSREPRFLTARASRCLRVHRDTFWEIVEAYPQVARGVIGMLARKMEALTASRVPSPGC